ncbi:hypothetical protein GQ600_26412 [Phytophthora cactorum]|nr:hypothetical protein GQ600_26412 [Phytophthora cactorum]
MGSMSSSSVTATQQEKAAIVDEGDTNLHNNTAFVEKEEAGSCRATPEAEAATRAREERRAIAREYMQLQKHSRRIWNAQAKEQSQLEQDKRQQQLQVRGDHWPCVISSKWEAYSAERAMMNYLTCRF